MTHVGWMAGRKASEDDLGVPKGMRAVLEQRVLIPMHAMNADEMREALGSQPDFKNENLTSVILLCCACEKPLRLCHF